MNIDVRGVHYEVKQKDREMIEKKMHRINHAQKDIVSIRFNLIKEKKEYKLEAIVHYRWGHESFLHVNDYDLYEGFDKLFDKVEHQIIKEKERIKKH